MLSSVATDIKRLIEEGQCLLSEERRRREYAEWQLKKLQAQLFGSKSEKMDPEQLQLLLEGFEAAAVIDEPGQDAALIVKETKAKKPSKRMFFPDDLPEEVLEFDLPESERTCPQTGAERRFMEFYNLHKVYPTPKGPLTVVEDFNLLMDRGEFVSLIGHSGCGKSTLLNMAAGLNAISKGAIVLEAKGYAWLEDEAAVGARS